MRLPVSVWLSAGLLALAASRAVAAPTLLGNWLTEDRTGVIAIAVCGNAVCGRIVGMSQPLDTNEKAARDTHGAAMCGLPILRASADAPDHYVGQITDPSNGSVWHCAVWLDAAGNLNVRGYVLLPLLGQTQIWTRFDGQVSAGCALN